MPDNRRTIETETLPVIDVAPEFGGSLDNPSLGDALSIRSLAMAFANNATERGKIVREHFPEASLWIDKGNNLGVTLPSGKRYMLDKPGIRTHDVLGLVASAAPAIAAAPIVAPLVAGAGLSGAAGAIITAAATEATGETIRQGTQVAGGGDFNAGDVALAGLIGGGFGGVGYGIGQAWASRAAGKAESVVEAPGAIPAETSASPAGEVRKAVRELGASQAKQQDKLAAVADLVQPNSDILEAGQRLGITPGELLPHHYSDNEAFRDVIGGMASSQRWSLMEAEDALMKKLDDVTSDFITNNGGALDGSIVSQEIRDALEAEINGLSQRSKELYKEVDEVISPLTEVDAPRTLEHLDTVADQYGGLERLTSFERDVSKDFGPDGVRTWAGFNDRRADVGDALEKTLAGDKRRDYRRAAMLYGPMKDDARDIARSHGVLEPWDTANKYHALSEELKATKTKLLGRNDQHDAMPKVISAMKGLASGKTSAFQDVMSLIPDDLQNQAVMTGLREMLTQGSKAADVLHLPGAVTWLRDVMENKESYRMLTTYMSPGASQQLPDVFTLFNGINRGRKSLLGDTGNKLKDLAKAIAAEGGFTKFATQNPIATKIAKSAVIAKTGPIGGYTARAVSEAMAGASDEVVSKAADLIRTPEFTKLATAMDSATNDAAQEAVNTASIRTLHDETVKTEQFKSWYQVLPPATKAVVRRGFVEWLIDEMEAVPVEDRAAE